MNVNVRHCIAADLDGTPLEPAFEGVPGDTPVVQAFDADSGALVALARSGEQPLRALEQEARFQLARCVGRAIARAMRDNKPSGDNSDPRA